MFVHRSVSGERQSASGVPGNCDLKDVPAGCCTGDTEVPHEVLVALRRSRGSFMPAGLRRSSLRDGWNLGVSTAFS